MFGNKKISKTSFDPPPLLGRGGRGGGVKKKFQKILEMCGNEKKIDPPPLGDGEGGGRKELIPRFWSAPSNFR